MKITFLKHFFLEQLFARGVCGKTLLFCCAKPIHQAQANITKHRSIYLNFFITILCCSATSSVQGAPNETPGRQTPVVQHYAVVDLGAPDGCSFACGINDSGQVVGYTCTNDYDVLATRTHAFLYSKGSLKRIATPGEFSQALGINNKGQIVGIYVTNDISCVFLYSNGSLRALGTLGFSSCYASGINNNGQIVGWGIVKDRQQSFSYLNGSKQYLCDSPGVAQDINDSGQVVGWINKTNSNFEQACLYQNGLAQNICTSGANDESQAYKINASGQVVGFYFVASGNADNAFLYSKHSMQDLGNLSGKATRALGINDKGQVVGWGTLRDDLTQHAFLFSGGVMQDLNNLITPASGWMLGQATAINNVGQIVGTGTNSFGHTRAFLLNPLPLGSALHTNGVEYKP